MSKDNIKEGLKEEGFELINEVKGKERFNYVMPAMEKMYRELNPYQLTSDGDIIYLNSTEDINDNAYMFQCQDLYRNASATHSACINLRTDLAIGNGLEPVNPSSATTEFLQRINRVGDDWQAIWEKINLDMQLHGMFSLQCIYNRRGYIVEVLHVDISNVRAVSPEANKEFIPFIKKWALSQQWAKIRNRHQYVATDDNHVEIANFMPPVKIDGSIDMDKLKEDQFRQLLVHRDYQSGNFPYGLPHYNSVLKYVQLDEKLASYHLNKVAGGFFPNVIVKLPGTPENEEDKQKFIRDFKRKYMGEDGEKIMFIWSEESEGDGVQIVPFSTNDDNQIFEILDRVTTQKILTAHQIQPELAALPTQGQSLGGDANKINVSRSYTIETVIKPIQKSMLSTINKIFRYNGLEDITVTNEALKLNVDENEQADNNPAETQTE